MTAKHTPGPWEAIEKTDCDPSEGTHWIRCPIGALGYWRGHKRDHEDCKWILNGPDALLIAEAGTVHHETGLTPRQLVERVKELAEVLRGLDEAYCRSGGPLTRAERNEDRKRLIAARAAIAEATGETP